MICRYDYLSRYPTVFLQMTGLRLNEFAELLTDILPALRLLNTAGWPVPIVSVPWAAAATLIWPPVTRSC
jgi:hypothetical protein